ncbi:hypothetical protein F2Q69_00046978 [Brassica cretica]|uniref:Uncharacterized protein n=1 Tax=Brassica cretica TaxID=69181 RepID=A0A8S9PWQ1_BRACR|nr:hypothetical protein F2Q69_00046978 [Brassica cretica]
MQSLIFFDLHLLSKTSLLIRLSAVDVHIVIVSSPKLSLFRSRVVWRPRGYDDSNRCSRKWVSDPASPLRDLTRGRRDCKGHSSNLYFLVLAKSRFVVSVPSAMGFYELCSPTSSCGCRQSGFNWPVELKTPATEGGEHDLQRKQRQRFGGDCGCVESRILFGSFLLRFNKFHFW